MTALVQAGATLIPAMPGFYHQPTTVEEVADTVVDRILDHLALPDPKIKRWQG
jgi:4-hydroxy-3-polyprenylbenzoate decarboxylase